MRIHDVTAECKSLGFTCRWTGEEFRLARPLHHYSGNHASQSRQNELEAYYTDDGLDCIQTARSWHEMIHGTKRERSVA